MSPPEGAGAGAGAVAGSSVGTALGARGSGVAVNVGRTVVIDEAYLVRSGAFGYEDEVTQAKLDLLCLRESTSAAAAVACHPEGVVSRADDDADPLPPEVVDNSDALKDERLPTDGCCDSCVVL